MLGKVMTINRSLYLELKGVVDLEEEGSNDLIAILIPFTFVDTLRIQSSHVSNVLPFLHYTFPPTKRRPRTTAVGESKISSLKNTILQRPD